MKWVNGLTWEERNRRRDEKEAKLTQWRRWFAWYPVIVGETPDRKRTIKVWWQYVMRSGYLDFDGGWLWDYEEIKDATEEPKQ